MLSKAKTALIIHNANSIVARCHSTGQVSDLQGAINLLKIALNRLPKDDVARTFSVHQQLGFAYWRSYYQLKYPPDLEGALQYLSIVVSSADPQASADDHFRYARALAFNHSLSMDFDDLEKAIRHLRRALDWLKTRATDVPAEMTALLCSVLRSHHACTGTFGTLHESLLSIRALNITNPGTASKLFLYAESYRSLCEWQNQSVDWEQCVKLYRLSLRALPERHEDRWWYSARLASALCAQYYFNSGDIAHHDEAMKVLITAMGQWQEVDPRQPSCRFHRDRRAFLAKLDLHFGFSYATEDEKDEFKEMDTKPGKGYGYGHGVGDTKGLRISQAMYELAQALHIRYQQFRDRHDLDDALKLIRASLNIRRDEGSGLVPMLVSLASILITKDGALVGSKDELAEARDLCDEVLQRPKEDYACSFFAQSMKGSLAVTLASDGTADDGLLENAISLQATAISQCPAKHCLRSIILYTQSVLSMRAPAPAPFETQLSTIYETLRLIPPNSPLRLHPLLHAAHLHWQFYRETGTETEFTTAMARFDDTVNLQGAGADARLNLAMQWLTAISAENNANTINQTTLTRLFEAQRTMLDLLPNVASLGRDPQSRLDAAKVFQNLAQTIAVRAPNVETAVEVLEQGRSVFWGQALRLRLPPDIERLTDPALKELAKALENEWDRKVQREEWEVEQDHYARQTMRSIFDWKPTPIFKEEKALHRREEHARFNQLVEAARKIPGCERLMMPDQFEHLKRAGNRGVVVILVTSPSSCEAITVGVCAGEPKYLRLPLPNISLTQLQNLLGSLKDAYNSSRSADRSMREARRPILNVDDSKSASKFKFYRVLRILWSDVVSPVLLAFNLKQKNVVAGARPRLWWCPTGPFAFLPLHAAGIYQAPNSELECCSDFVVSSYTPSLGTLNATRHDFDALAGMEPRVQLIAEPAAPNQPRIPHTAAEIEAIKELIPAQYLNSTNDKDTSMPRPSVESVLASLPATSILHLACHGRQDERMPLSSGFMLSDGQLKVSQLMKLNLKKSVFAFLSACESAAGDHSQPDESIHLGAALLFAGFRSVIGTMWSMDDADGPEVARVVYREMFKSGTCNYEAVPYALELAVRQLRDKGIHPSRWATYVHMGL